MSDLYTGKFYLRTKELICALRNYICASRGENPALRENFMH